MRTRFGVQMNDDDSRPILATLRRGDDISQWGLEGAFVTGPFSLQAEYVDLEVDGGTDMAENMRMVPRFRCVTVI